MYSSTVRHLNNTIGLLDKETIDSLLHSDQFRERQLIAILQQRQSNHSLKPPS